MNVVTDVTKWSFLDEPLYRWFIFFGAIIFIAWTWKGVLSFV